MADSYVLGINVSHDISAALVKNGVLVGAIAEERLNRIKRFTGGVDVNGMTNKHIPHRATQYCFDIARIGWLDLSLIVVSTCVVVNYQNYRTRALTLEEIIAQLPPDIDPKKIMIVGHHIGHAASVFYPSPFKEAAIVVADGGGSFFEKKIPGSDKVGLFEERATIYHGQENDIQLIKQYGDGQPSDGFLANSEHASIGDFYQSATVFMGFKGGDEGKTMGLAPYGSDRYYQIFQDAISFEKDRFVMRNEFLFNKWHNRKAGHYQDRFGPDRLAGQKLRQVDKDIASAVQFATEKAMIQLAREAYELTRSQNLCLSGGVALNSVANKKILDEVPFKNVYIQPAAGDDGCAIGNAFLGWVNCLHQPRRWEMRNAYTGREYSQEEINRDIKKYHSWVEVVPGVDVVKETSRLIADGKIVGWFQGGSEFGPRALGHRSILCDAREGRMKDILNRKVKHREMFRPFAPSILEECNSDYFDLDCPSPFMLLIAKVKNPSAVSAVTHVDQTARVQTVTRKDNGIYYDLIKSYHELTGIPVILNTSFNVDGEPIVETPEDAIRCFIGTKMDYLVLGQVMLRKKMLQCFICQIWPRDFRRVLYQTGKVVANRFPVLKKLRAKAMGSAKVILLTGATKVPG